MRTTARLVSFRDRPGRVNVLIQQRRMETYILHGIVPRHVAVEYLADLLWGNLGGDKVRSKNGDDKIYVFRFRFLANHDFNGLIGIDEIFQLLSQDRVLDLRSQCVNRLLERSDPVIQRHGEDALEQRTRAERLGEKQIKNARHDRGRIGDADDILQYCVGNQRMDPLCLGEQLWGIVFGEEKMVDRRSNPAK